MRVMVAGANGAIGSRLVRELIGRGQWVGRLLREADTSVPVEEGRVHATHWWIAEDSTYLGAIALRHELNDFVLRAGGHIGYGIRPSARGRGLATWALWSVLARARALGLRKVLVTCDDSNLASARAAGRDAEAVLAAATQLLRRGSRQPCGWPMTRTSVAESAAIWRDESGHFHTPTGEQNGDSMRGFSPSMAGAPHRYCPPARLAPLSRPADVRALGAVSGFVYLSRWRLESGNPTRHNSHDRDANSSMPGGRWLSQ